MKQITGVSIFLLMITEMCIYVSRKRCNWNTRWLLISAEQIQLCVVHVVNCLELLYGYRCTGLKTHALFRMNISPQFPNWSLRRWDDYITLEPSNHDTQFSSFIFQFSVLLFAKDKICYTESHFCFSVSLVRILVLQC